MPVEKIFLQSMETSLNFKNFFREWAWLAVSVVACICIIITSLLCSSNENLLNFKAKKGLCVKTKNYYWQQLNQLI